MRYKRGCGKSWQEIGRRRDKRRNCRKRGKIDEKGQERVREMKVVQEAEKMKVNEERGV